MQKTFKSYHPLRIGIHWFTLILLIVVYALIELRELYPKGSDPREAMKAWHSMLGLVILGLVFVRLVLRTLYKAPPIEPPLPVWQDLPAQLMHVTLYVFLIVMPLLGWLMLSAKGKTVPFFGLELPPLIPADKALGKSIENIHARLGTIGYYLIALHALAGLFHHYVMHDNTLRRMLPGRSKSAA